MPWSTCEFYLRVKARPLSEYAGSEKAPPAQRSAARGHRRPQECSRVVASCSWLKQPATTGKHERARAARGRKEREKASTADAPSSVPTTNRWSDCLLKSMQHPPARPQSEVSSSASPARATSRSRATVGSRRCTYPPHAAPYPPCSTSAVHAVQAHPHGVCDSAANNYAFV
jgi:hypothetical protein